MADEGFLRGSTTQFRVLVVEDGSRGERGEKEGFIFVDFHIFFVPFLHSLGWVL